MLARSSEAVSDLCGPETPVTGRKIEVSGKDTGLAGAPTEVPENEREVPSASVRSGDPLRGVSG
jgi:hypothetical protein